MARTVRRRHRQRIYWVEIGFLILGLIALRPSLVTDLVSMGRGTTDYRYAPRSQFVSDYAPAYQPNYPNTNYPNTVGFSSYYPNWNHPIPPSTYAPMDPNAGAWNPSLQQIASTTYPSSNAAWPNAQVHQWVHNGNSAPLVASPSWNNPIPSPAPNRYPSTVPVYTGRY